MRRLLIGLALCALACSSWAGVALYEISNFNYTLLDTIPDDGIAPSILTEQQAPNAFGWRGTTTVGTEVLISYDVNLSLFAWDNGDAVFGEWLFISEGFGGGPLFNFQGPCCGPDYFHPTLYSEAVTLHITSIPINDVGPGLAFEPSFTAYGSLAVDCCGSGFPYPPLEPLQPIPEPSTYALLLGGLGLLAFRHSNRRSARRAATC